MSHSNKVLLSTAHGDTAEIALHGAHVLSWSPGNTTTDKIYLSKLSSFSEGVAIRGGVPILFPQFGNAGEYQKHGFARTKLWELKTLIEGKNSTSATFFLASNTETKKLWPFAFEAQVTVKLTENKIHFKLQIKNLDSKAIQFTCGLHGYFAVTNIKTARLSGLEGIQFKDDGLGDWKGEAETLEFQHALDRVYKNSKNSLQLIDGKTHITFEQTGFNNTVIWNPGEINTQSIVDMENNDYEKFVCIEPAAIFESVSIEPNNTWEGTQTVTHELAL